MRLSHLLLLLFFLSPAYCEPIVLCDVDKGLELINQENYLPSQINMILAGCDKTSPNDPQVLLLHGLFARKTAQRDKNYESAINWLEKARTVAPDNLTILQELAATYVLANKFSQSLAVYQLILNNDPTNRTALLGVARIYRLQGKFAQATTIYQTILASAPHDTDALNGLAWVKAAQNDLAAASQLFQETLTIQPENQEAQLGLSKVKQTEIQKDKSTQLCNASEGLILLKKEVPPLAEIKAILNQCAANHVENTETFLLYGLLARQEALSTQNYERAITWLQKASNSAATNDKGPALELAVTYEWAKQLQKALAIYDYILAYEPNNRAALLGKARIFRLDNNYSAASDIYRQFLQTNPNDVDAINGLGWIELAEKNFLMATDYFHKTLAIQSTNKEAFIALNQIKAAQIAIANLSPPCPIATGLTLINQKNPNVPEVEHILKQCKEANFQNTEVELLQGVLARYRAEKSNNYNEAIFWLQKAVSSATKDNDVPALELAFTYERAKQFKQAALIYQQLLARTPENRAALIGRARLLRANHNLSESQSIYEHLLARNANDVDALNGLGWNALAQKELVKATSYFKKTLALQPSNDEAQLALKQIAAIEAHPAPFTQPSLCDADQGLMLLTQTHPPIKQIEAILRRCDKNTPNSTSTLMLHGLLARHFALQTNHFDEAISWLKLAAETAARDNNAPLLELAITYEWAGQLKPALAIYQHLLFAKPDYTIALLGQARVLRAMYLIKPSIATYEKILQRNPTNVEALNGFGLTLLTDFKLNEARVVFDKALSLNPKNPETRHNLQILNATTKNILAITGGYYAVPPKSSKAVNLFYFRNLNATDGFMMYATHNSEQIESGFSSGPSLLPNNSLLLGYQRIVPRRYGWQVNYDARQHNGLPFENRAFGSGNLFLNNNLEWFGGLRLAYPNPWTTQLLISGLTAYTPSVIPNITFTGFWAYQQIGGKSTTYALDFSKEFTNRLFYDFGPSYLIEQDSFEIHGRLILPTFINQALVAECSHYFFNRSTFFTAGWRFYWA